MLLECAAAFPLTFMALRYFNGAGGDPDGEIGECHVPETHVIPLLLDVAAGASDRFTPFGHDYPTVDGTCIRNYIHVSDLADGHVQAVRALLGGAESAALNIGTGHWGGARSNRLRAPGYQSGHSRPSRSAPARRSSSSHRGSDRGAHRLDRQPRYADLATQVTHPWAWRRGGVKKWKTDAAVGREDRVALNGIP